MTRYKIQIVKATTGIIMGIDFRYEGEEKVYHISVFASEVKCTVPIGKWVILTIWICYDTQCYKIEEMEAENP